MTAGKVYVVVAKPMRETWAERALRKAGAEAGFVVFSPMITRWRQAQGRKFRQRKPVLPMYLFVWSANIEADYTAIRHARDVAGILGLDGKAREIPDEWVATLLMAQVWGAFDLTRSRKRKMSVGQAVRIAQGAFSGYLGKVEKVGSGDRVTVRVTSRFGGVMEIDGSKLELIKSAA